MNAEKAFNIVAESDCKTILDVGSGDGIHAKKFRESGKEVYTISLIPPADIIGDFLDIDLPKFDCIWASHVLEHQRNVGLFLDKCFNTLKDDGLLAITVPPLKHEIVGGHVTLWNAGLLLYNLILAGFDCSKAIVKQYGYNISVILRKKAISHKDLLMDYGDIEKLSKYFPFEAVHGFDGRLNG